MGANGVKANQIEAHGNLHFTEIVAAPVFDGAASDNTLPTNQLASQIRASVQWPLTSVATPADIGNLNFAGEQVPAQWLIALIDRQIQNAGVEAGLGFQQQGDRVFIPGLTFVDDLKKSLSFNKDPNCPRCAPGQNGCSLATGCQ